jgi:ubiquinone/menaquinone biosynthesis C-methylase UbiE
MKYKDLGSTQSIFSRNEGSRIAYYRINSPAGCDFWDDHWHDNTSKTPEENYQPYMRGYLGRGQLRRVMLKYLPPDGLILDGGCGIGKYVMALRSRGYNCIGIDFAEKTIARIKDSFPDLPIEVGDVCHLNFKEETIDAYISLGVVEHFKEGPQTALKEAARVLKKDGLLLVSVPQAFRWRRESSYPEDTPLPEKASFYQYAFTSEEFREMLRGTGFRVEAEYGYDAHYALTFRFKLLRELLRRFPRMAHVDILLDQTPVGLRLARMRLFVAKRKVM